MLAVDRAAQSAYAQDVAAGRGGSSSLHSAAIDPASRQPAASSSKPKLPVSKFANYSTAASLGYTDEDAERAAALVEQRSKEGTVGAWEAVVPPPPPLPVPDDGIKTVGGTDEAEVDVKPKPPPDDPQIDENDFRTFKVRQRKATFLGKGLGALYDPGEIIVKKKQKFEEPEPASSEPNTEGESLPLETQPESGAAEERGCWQALDEQVNPTIVPPRQRAIMPVTGAPGEQEETPQLTEFNNEATIKPEETEEIKPLVQDTLALAEPASEATSGGGSLFKRKIKRPVNSSASRRGGRF